MGVGLTHTENLMIKKLREVRETSGVELNGEEAEPTIGRKFKTKSGGRLQERIPERGVSLQTETGAGRNGCAYTISSTSPRQIPLLLSDEGQ